MELLEMMQKRRSIRTYTGETITEEQLQIILQAGLLSASSRAIRPWELIVVKNKEMLQKMAECRNGSANMLKQASAAIVVIANPELSDVWVEDCAIVMANMHLMADALGLGSCWIQGRRREANHHQTTQAYLQVLLYFPKEFQLEAILSLGIPAQYLEKHELAELPMDKVHWEQY